MAIGTPPAGRPIDDPRIERSFLGPVARRGPDARPRHGLEGIP